MKKRIALISTIALIALVVTSAPVFAANQEGDRCAKAGVTTRGGPSITLICKKVGKSLRWKKMISSASKIKTQPKGAVNGVAFTGQPVVRIVDSDGNTVTNSTVNVVATIASGTGTLSGITTVAAVNGVATFTDLVITGTAGPSTLIFTSSGLTSATSDAFVLTFGTAEGSAITTQPSGAVNGVAFTAQPVVRIVDSGGNTVTNSTVNVVATIASGTGTLSGTMTVAAVSGIATFANLVITGTAGPFTLTFTPTALAPITSASLALTVGAASASVITAQSSGAVNGVAFTGQPVVRIVDSGGNTVTNSTVNVVATIASGTGTLSGITTVAAVSGVATFTDLVITGTAGPFTLTFTPAALTPITSALLALTDGTAAGSVITIQPSGAVNGVAFTTQPVVRIVDSGGNTVTNSTVNVVATIASGTGGTLSGITTVAAVNGVATFANLVITGTAGNFTLTFTPTALSPITSSSLALTVGAASVSAITAQPSGAVNGVAFSGQPVVRIVDSGGNTVTNSTVNVVATIAAGTGGTLSGITTVAAVNGVATFANLVITGTAGSFTLTFTPTALSPITSAAFALTFGTAAVSVITTQPSGAINGVAFSGQPVVRIVDSNGNTVTNSTVNVVATIASGTGGTLSGITTVAAVSGVATFANLVITGTAGPFTLTFTPTALAPITSAAFALTFGTASVSVFTIQPIGAVNGVAFTTQPVVRIVDSGGNTVTNSTVNVVATIASGTGGALSGTTTVAAVAGVASFTNLVITGTAGPFTLTFTPAALTPITSALLTLTVGAASASVITIQPSGAVNGVAFTGQPVVRLVDSGGNTVTNSTVNVVATIASGTGGTLSGTTTVAAVAGVASFTNLVITGTTGPFTLTFTPAALSPITSAAFALTFGTAAGSAIMTQPSGAVNGVAFTAQPVVRIIDSNGNTVTNSTVNVVATIASGTGGTLSGITSVAAVSGVATFTNLVITGTAGPFTLTFTPSGLTSVTSGSLALTVGAASASAITIQPSGAVNGVAFTGQPVVRIVDSGGNTITSDSSTVVTVSIASGTGTLSTTLTAIAVSGVATFTDLVITGTTGPFTLTFTPAALSPVTSAAFALTFGTAAGSAIMTQPSGAVKDVAFRGRPVVRIVDSNGNTVTNSRVNVVATLAPGTGGTLSGITTVAAVNGVATFTNLVITGTAGNFTLIFTPTALSPKKSDSFDLTDDPVGTTTDPVAVESSPLIANTFDVQIPGTSTSMNATITITIPQNSTSEPATFNVYASSDAANVDAGFVSVRIESVKTSDNSLITALMNAIEIRIPSSTASVSPAWSRDGSTWTLLPQLSEPFLPEGQADGYFVNADGSYSLFTRHLTIFGLLRTQKPLTLTASRSELKVGQTATLLVTGGSGTGALMFRSIDPTICSVTSEGVVLGSSAGNCSVTVSKQGLESYLDITSAPIAVSISASEMPNSLIGSAITVRRRAGITTIKVSLPLKYAGKRVTVELGIKKRGHISYRVLGRALVNLAGRATLKTKQLIPLKAIVRTKIGSKVVAKR